MINNKYIIKSLTPWMMDELITFSKKTSFDIIFLRKQDEFYKEGIEKLILNHINNYLVIFNTKHLLKKLYISLLFFFSNLNKFNFDYNGVIGIKSIYWFLKLDISLFSKNSNIHAQFATQPSIVALLIKKYYNNKPIYSFTFHAYDIYFKNNWLNMLIENSYKCFSISKYNIKYIEDHYLISDKMKLVRLGVFRDNINKEPLKTESNTFTLGLMSWFVEKKGVSYLLEAINKLKKLGYNNIKLILAGDGPLKNDYLSIIDKNNLSDMVSFIGKIKGKQKEEFYNSIDAFILPSISLKNDQDGIPVVLMEAIAYSLPIISTDVSGIPEICINNYNGFLIKEKNVKAIIDSITDLYKNDDKKLCFSTNSLLLSNEYDIQLNSIKKIKLLSW